MNRRKFLRMSSGVPALCSSARWAAASNDDRKQRLLIGAQTNVYGVPIRDYDQLLRILDTLARLDYHGFETNYLSLAPQAANARACRRAFESRHVTFIGPHSSAALYDRARAVDEIEDLRKIIGYSAEMGATQFVLSGSKLPYDGRPVNMDERHNKADGLNRIGRACAEAGLKLAYHNHWGEFLQQPDEMSFLLSQTDPKLVWFSMNIGHMQGYADPVAFSDENFRRMANYHLRDVKRGETGKKNIQTAEGEGEVDFKAILAPLLNSNWKGWLIVEEEGNYPNPAEHPEALLRHARAYVKQITSV